MQLHTSSSRIICALLLTCSLSFGSCASYRIATHAQGSTDYTPANSKKAYSLFWGLINKPQVILTPVCDSLGVNGVSEVKISTSFGNVLVTMVTLGIYCPAKVQWKCAKPCRIVQQL
jgi:hypothetical protein